MVEPPTWIMSWPSLEAARRFWDSMSAADCAHIERVVLDVIDQTGQLIATDCTDKVTEFKTQRSHYQLSLIQRCWMASDGRQS
jgi:hypothetical protein